MNKSIWVIGGLETGDNVKERGKLQAGYLLLGSYAKTRGPTSLQLFGSILKHVVGAT